MISLGPIQLRHIRPQRTEQERRERAAQRRANMKIPYPLPFGTRLIITDPEEDNDEWQGREAFVLREWPEDRGGRRVRVAIEGENFHPLLHLSECTVQAEAVKYLPAPPAAVREVVRKPTRAEALRLAAQVLAEQADLIAAKK